MQKTVYIVQIQGWGDREEEFYNCGTYATRKKAEAGVEECLQGWEADGGDRADVVYEIEEHAVA
jgi:hypothetical protein